jgi:hypothetical protein
MKVPTIKFHGNLSKGSRADICEQTDGWTDRQRGRTDLTKLICTFHDHGNAPNNQRMKGTGLRTQFCQCTLKHAAELRIQWLFDKVNM